MQPVTPAGSPRVIRLSSTDVDAFLAFRSEGLQGDPDSFGATVEDDRRVDRDMWRARLEDSYVAAVKDADTLLGVGGFFVQTGDKRRHKGYIWGMYVRPENRGQGIGHALMTALVDHARGRVRLVQLTVTADNQGARAFYESFGFKPYGVEPQSMWTGTRFVDEIMMWLPLTPN
jgi:ribosomal protein S18 acetylase RimI-like enzyme